MKTMTFLLAFVCLPWSMILNPPPLGGTSIDCIGGMQVILSQQEKRYQRGTPIRWDLRFQNISNHKIAFAGVDNVLINVIGPDGKRINYLDDVRTFDTVSVEDWPGMVLQPGEYMGTLRYGALSFDRPGQYKLWVTYHGPGFSAGIQSNRVTFKID